MRSQWYPITNIQMQIGIKPICDWPIYLTASADERLAGLHYADFLSLHYIVYENHFLQPWHKLNYCQLPSYIHHRATYSWSWSWAINFHLIFHTTTVHYLCFSCIHLQPFCFQPWFPFYYLKQFRSHHTKLVKACNLRFSYCSDGACWPWRSFWPWKWCASHVWRGLPLCQF